MLDGLMSLNELLITELTQSSLFPVSGGGPMGVRKINQKWTAGFSAFFVLALLVIATPAHAIIGIGVTGKAGTTGLGGDVTVPIVDGLINARFGYNNMSFINHAEEVSGVNYSIATDFNSVPLLVDFHPFHGGFRLSGGIYYLKHNFDAIARPGTDIRIGNTVVTAATAGQIKADIQLGQDFAPYLGLGWGNAADSGFLPFGIGVSIDVGVLYQGKSEVSLSQSGNTAAGTIPQADLVLEAQSLENSLNEVKWFPVATIGFHIAF